MDMSMMFFAQWIPNAIFMMVVFVLRIILAVAVYQDAERQTASRRGLFLFGPGIWSFAVLVSGLLGVAAYWAIHHSTLRPPSNDSTE